MIGLPSLPPPFSDEREEDRRVTQRAGNGGQEGDREDGEGKWDDHDPPDAHAQQPRHRGEEDGRVVIPQNR